MACTMRAAVACTAFFLISVACAAGIVWGIIELTGGSTEELVLPGNCDTGAERCWAVFAMGCFWCAESDYEKSLPLPAAVGDAISGYTAGRTEEPTYSSHSSDGHYEAVAIPYNPQLVSYEVLLLWFWQNVDYVDDRGQFCDRGDSYRPAIFALNELQRAAAEHSISLLKSQTTSAVRTPVLPASRFWMAEDYHQDYYKKEASCYEHYRKGCGRDSRLRQLRGEHIFRPMANWAAGPNYTWRNESEAALVNPDSDQDRSSNGLCNGFSVPGPQAAFLVIVVCSGVLICGGGYMACKVRTYMFR